MILYISNATAYPIYDRQFRSGKIAAGYQVQKFNSNIISGLGAREEVTALSCLPYEDVPAERIDETIDGVRYLCIQNTAGAMHRFGNLFRLTKEGIAIIRRSRPRCILCDAIATSPCLISRLLGTMFRIPVVGIITDIPGMMGQEENAISADLRRMQGFDGYILLTQQMDELVNPKKRPAMVMEGLSAMHLPELRAKDEKQIILYTGSLWKELAGIEYLTEGFCQAAIPNTELHFYGSGELVPWLEEQSRKNPAIRYMGCITNEEIVQKQCEAALLVNPRPSQEAFCKYSFPSKTIEYMASGTPVLMTRLPGVPKEYFDYVYTIEEETAGGICRSLTGIFGQSEAQRTRFGMAARDFVKTNKSCDAQCGRILAFLDKLTASHT